MSYPNVPKVASVPATCKYSAPGGHRNLSMSPVISVDDRGQQIGPPADANGCCCFYENPVGGARNMATTPAYYEIRPAANEVIMIGMFNFHLLDDNILLGDFGGIAPLTNGILFDVRAGPTDTVVFDMLGNDIIKKNSDFNKHSGHFSTIWDVAAVNLNDLLNIRFNMLNMTGRWLILDGSLEMSSRLTVQDDLTGITEFFLKATGLEYNLDDVLVGQV